MNVLEMGWLSRNNLYSHVATVVTQCSLTHDVHRYIRIKRRNQTFCFLCNASDTVAQLKAKVAAVVKQHPAGGKASDDDDEETLIMQLIHPESTDILEDEDLLSEYELKDNAVLHVVFEVADNEFETVDIQSTDLQDSW